MFVLLQLKSFAPPYAVIISRNGHGGNTGRYGGTGLRGFFRKSREKKPPQMMQQRQFQTDRVPESGFFPLVHLTAVAIQGAAVYLNIPRIGIEVDGVEYVRPVIELKAFPDSHFSRFKVFNPVHTLIFVIFTSIYYRI
jgi:hypothetical protein